MAIKITNTLSGKKEEFKPLHQGEVSFYQCGPTVYWTQHIGNLRASTMADVIHRTFLYFNYKVNFVRNYTDVGHLTNDNDIGEDKMEKGAQREGLSPIQIADKYIKIFEEDTKSLNILEPTQKIKATSVIEEIQEMVKILLEKEIAYQTDLAIYFDTAKAKNYNRLSGQTIEDKKEGAGTGDVNDTSKKNPADFSLWFFKKGKHSNAIQTWPSPWGEGFPGWHLECSAIVRKFLGPTIDVHMGGIEHIPVHHTNEIAQSESVNEAPFVNYWVHNEWLLANNGKMSKSEGTGYSLAEVIAKGFSPMALRYFFLQAHYRSKQNFTWEALEASQNGLKNLQNQIRELGKDTGEVDQPYKEKFEQAIGDDFNTPQAVAIMFDILKSDLANKEKLATLLDFDKVLGLDFYKLPTEETPQEVIDLAEERKLARNEQDWVKSDSLRQQINALGYEIKDSEQGYILWKK